MAFKGLCRSLLIHLFSGVHHLWFLLERLQGLSGSRSGLETSSHCLAVLEAVKYYGVRASLLLGVLTAETLQEPEIPPHFFSKAWCLARKPLNGIIQNSWWVWKILAIFADDLILTVKQKICRLQQSRLLPPLQQGRFLMNGTAALQACWWCGGGCCTGSSSVARHCSCEHATCL